MRHVIQNIPAMDHVISDHESCFPRSSCCSEVELATFNQVRRENQNMDAMMIVLIMQMLHNCLSVQRCC